MDARASFPLLLFSIYFAVYLYPFYGINQIITGPQVKFAWLVRRQVQTEEDIMKPTFLRWVISLVVIFSLIPFQSGGVHAAASDASRTVEDVITSISSPLSLEGWFHILWGDPRDAAGKARFFTCWSTTRVAPSTST